MDYPWLDRTHRRLWRLSGESAHLCDLQDGARQLAAAFREQIQSLHARSACGWTAEKAQLLAALDKAQFISTIAAARQPATVPLGLVLFELAARDGGLAALCLSRFLAQMPITDFGIAEQNERYASGKNLLHGALCLTEPIPGAGAEALLLMGTYRPAGDANALSIEIDKRGRFTSHMEFADFVVAAVQGVGGARGSALVILEPHDEGVFDRGAPAKKIGHRVSSATHPSFRLRVPAARIVGGYAMEDGILRPYFGHRQLLEPALRRARALLGLMTAAKALAAAGASPVAGDFLPGRGCDGPEFWLPMTDLWAAGEAAASLGFLAARHCDRLDAESARDPSADANLFSPAAKLFASTRIIPALSRVAAAAGANADGLYTYIADAQVEAVYMGPEALQRRLISAAMTAETFALKVAEWTGELEGSAGNFSASTAKNLAAGFRLWSRTLCVLRDAAGSGKEAVIHGTRQAAAFAMADSLCALLAARSFLLDAAELDAAALEAAGLDADDSIVADLVRLATASAVSHAAQISISSICGGSRGASPELRRELNALRAEAYAGLAGFQYARERIARFLANRARETEST
jgi:hypothetical protein